MATGKSATAKKRDARRNKIAKLLLQDKTVKEIYEKVGCAPATARRDIAWLKENNEDVKKHFGLADASEDKTEDKAPAKGATKTEEPARKEDETSVKPVDESNAEDELSSDYKPETAEDESVKKTETPEETVEKISKQADKLGDNLKEDRKEFARKLTGHEDDGTETETFQPLEDRTKHAPVKTGEGARTVSSKPSNERAEEFNGVVDKLEAVADSTENPDDSILGFYGTHVDPLAINETDWSKLDKSTAYKLFRKLIRKERMNTVGILALVIVVFVIVFIIGGAV